MIKNRRIIVFITAMALHVPAVVCAGQDTALYRKAQQMVKEGRPDFAFMQYRKIEKEYPGSRYMADALYASGEYYFRAKDYEKAGEFFDRFLKESGKEHGGMLFALMYQLWLADYSRDSGRREAVIKDILAFRRQAFVFADEKIYEYMSPLKHRHKVVYDIEKIQFLLEGEPFTQVAY